MMGPAVSCHNCGAAWDTWIGNACPSCGVILPEDEIEAFEAEHRHTFETMLVSAPILHSKKTNKLADLIKSVLARLHLSE